MEHSGMQDFGVSLAGARGSILLPSRDKNSISVLPYQAVPPVHGSIRSIPWAWPGVGEPRQRWELWGERQRSPHSLRGSWEHVEWGRARGCSEQQHPFPAGAGRAEALGMLVCAHVWEGGMKERAGLFLAGLEGADLALVTQRAMRKAPVMLRLLTALLQTTGTNFSPLCESAMLCPVCLMYYCSPEMRSSAFPKPPISWSQRLWLLQRPSKRSLIQSSLDLQDTRSCRTSILKDVRMGEAGAAPSCEDRKVCRDIWDKELG